MIFKGRRVIAAAAAVLFAGTVLQPVPSFAQNDTIIIRSSRIDIGKGVINPQGDTVIIGNEPVETVLLPVFDDSLALLPENAPSAQYIKVPWSELAARADSLRRAYRFSDAMALYRRAADAATRERTGPRYWSPVPWGWRARRRFAPAQPFFRGPG